MSATAKSPWSRDLRLSAVAFVAVFVAELGDKTQIAALGFAANSPGYRWIVFAAASAALILSALIGVLVGDLLARFLKPRTLSTIAGVIFIVCAVMFGLQFATASGAAPAADASEPAAPRAPWEAFLFTFAAIFVAELGDKTQLATMSLAAGNRHGRWAVFLGAATALTASSALACLAGRLAGEYLDPRYMKLAAAAVFAVLGVIFLAGRAEKGKAEFAWLTREIEKLYADEACARCVRLMRFLEHVEAIGSETVSGKIAELRRGDSEWSQSTCDHACPIDELHEQWHKRFDHTDESPLLKG
ncbi:MAG: TMEM165/GDT1 family protein [Planctomycetes bacterium]|nr:TMEM165/GDT1 family protein [Planctomycetota bacterium]